MFGERYAHAKPFPQEIPVGQISVSCVSMATIRHFSLNGNRAHVKGYLYTADLQILLSRECPITRHQIRRYEHSRPIPARLDERSERRASAREIALNL